MSSAHELQAPPRTTRRVQSPPWAAEPSAGCVTVVRVPAVLHPIGNVAMHLEDPPGVRQAPADRLGAADRDARLAPLPRGRCRIARRRAGPRLRVEIGLLGADGLTPPVGRRGAGPCDVFALGLGQQPVGLLRLSREPFRICIGILPADAHHGMVALLREPWWRQERVAGLVDPSISGLGVAALAILIAGRVHKCLELVARDGMAADRKVGTEGDLVQRAFELAPARLARR